MSKENQEVKDYICVEDFCGTACHGIPCQYWADYCLQDHLTRFGGDWINVPDMPCDVQPTTEAVNQWAKEHGGNWWEN